METILTVRAITAVTVLIVTIIVMVAFGAIVLLRTYKKAYGWYFALTMLGVVGWALGDMVLLFARTPLNVHLGAELFYIAPMIIPIFIGFFALNFPEDRRLGWKLPIGAGTCFGILSIIFLLNFHFFIKRIEITNSLNVPLPALPGFLIYAGYFSLFFILTYMAFIFKMRTLRGMNRMQVAYTFFGALFASMPALVTNLSLPIMGRTNVIWLGPLFTLIFAIAVTSAIIRHRLFDIRFYVIRSAAYLLTLFAITVLYVIPTVLLTGHFLHVPLKPLTIALLAFMTLIVAFFFPIVKRFFDRVTRKWFYHDGYDPQSFFNKFNQVLVESVEMDKLLQAACGVIVDDIKSEFCAVVLSGSSIRSRPRIIGSTARDFTFDSNNFNKRLSAHAQGALVVTDYLSSAGGLKPVLIENNVAVLVRLIAGPNDELGYVVMGPKKSGNVYSTQDFKVMTAVANELVIAIQNALRFEEIEQFNKTLQERIEEATKKLRRTNERLRLLDQTKDDFISMASHQLRTPLTSVKGYVSMVLDGDAGDITSTQRKLLNQSFVSAQRMVYLISDLLNVSRLRTGKFVIEPMPTNLATIIHDEVEQLQETAKSRGLTLTYHRPEHFPLLMLDETKIRQVIMNFIDNAIYYTPNGGHIAVELADKPQSIELTVTDDGIGVPKHEQHHLFTKFFRANNAKRARPDGTGLGLFMAKKVVMEQGGAIIFRSQENKGSTFGFTIAKDALPPLPVRKHK